MSFVGSAQANVSTGNQAPPAGYAAGDELVALTVSSNYAAGTPPTGWTQVYAALNGPAAYVRKADGGTNDTITSFTVSGQGFMAAYRGMTRVAVAGSSTASCTDPQNGSPVTATRAGQVVLAGFLAASNSPPAAVSPFTSDASVGSTVSELWEERTAPGAGAITPSSSGVATVQEAWVTVLLSPPPSPTGPVVSQAVQRAAVR